MTPTLTAFANSPDQDRGLARDMRVRRVLEEVPALRGAAGLFFGSSTAALPLLCHGVLRLPDPAALPTLPGAVVYLAGMVGVTLNCNAPLDRRLDTRAPAVWTPPGSPAPRDGQPGTMPGPSRRWRPACCSR